MFVFAVAFFDFIIGAVADSIPTIIGGSSLLVGLVLLFLGLSWWRSVRLFIQTAERAEGTVIEIVKELVESSKGNYINYTLVVEFADRFGQQHKHQWRIDSRPPKYSIGDKLQILYDRNDIDFAASAKVNHWIPLYTPTLLCLWCAGTCITVGALMLAFGRQF